MNSYERRLSAERAARAAAEHYSLAQLVTILEHPWDTLDVRYDAGMWRVTLNEDCGPKVESDTYPDLQGAILDAKRKVARLVELGEIIDYNYRPVRCVHCQNTMLVPRDGLGPGMRVPDEPEPPPCDPPDGKELE